MAATELEDTQAGDVAKRCEECLLVTTLGRRRQRGRIECLGEMIVVRRFAVANGLGLGAGHAAILRG